MYNNRTKVKVNSIKHVYTHTHTPVKIKTSIGYLLYQYLSAEKGILFQVLPFLLNNQGKFFISVFGYSYKTFSVVSMNE